MELVFHKENGLYITEFEVTSDFNVHLERSKGGKVSFYQKTTDGNYDHIEKLSKNIDKVFDYDFQALVYPKIIKITSECEFDVASLSTDGEVTEIKSQSKEVEIVSNGVTEIAPDAGFGYLSGVKVNVNVPTGGGESGGGSNYIYFDLSGYSSDSREKSATFMGASLVKIPSSGVQPIMLANSMFGTSQLIRSLTAVAIDSSATLLDASTNTSQNIMDILRAQVPTLDSLPTLTKEEFYNFEA